MLFWLTRTEVCAQVRLFVLAIGSMFSNPSWNQTLKACYTDHESTRLLHARLVAGNLLVNQAKPMSYTHVQ
jgi:hypothetical protein